MTTLFDPPIKIVKLKIQNFLRLDNYFLVGSWFQSRFSEMAGKGEK